LTAAVLALAPISGADGGDGAQVLSQLVFLSIVMFTLGVIGVLTRRNIIIIFMSIELILNAVNLNLVSFSRYLELQKVATALEGQVFAIFVIVVAAAEAAIGLGIVVSVYRNRGTIAADEINLLKW
jgi:NADH:ubiquinone oxidoreductase subunit K